MACLSILAGVGMEWRSVKNNRMPPAANAGGKKAVADESKVQSDASDKYL
jgi:hypothetical protein